MILWQFYNPSTTEKKFVQGDSWTQMPKAPGPGWLPETQPYEFNPSESSFAPGPTRFKTHSGQYVVWDPKTGKVTWEPPEGWEKKNLKMGDGEKKEDPPAEKEDTSATKSYPLTDSYGFKYRIDEIGGKEYEDANALKAIEMMEQADSKPDKKTGDSSIWDDVGKDETDTKEEATTVTGDTPTTDPNALAEYIRDIESQTVRGRERQFERAMASQPFMQYLNPTARAVVENRYFDPLSSQYLLAAAPTSLGGFGGWSPSSGEVDPGTASFRSYLRSPVTYGQGAYGPRADATNLNQWAPWNRQQWQSRLGGLFPSAGATQQPTEWDRGYLESLSLPEAQQMISSATMAGINPIAARAGRPAMGRAFSRWEEQNPTGWGQDLLSQFVSGDPSLQEMGFMNWAQT